MIGKNNNGLMQVEVFAHDSLTTDDGELKRKINKFLKALEKDEDHIYEVVNINQVYDVKLPWHHSQVIISYTVEESIEKLAKEAHKTMDKIMNEFKEV